MDGHFASLTVLGSGSSGNTTVLSFGALTRKCLLIDAGLSPLAVRKRMAEACIPGLVVGAILLTHLDTDHWQRGWTRQLERNPVPVVVRSGHRAKALEAGVPSNCLRVVADSFQLGALASVTAIEVPHDESGSTAYVVESAAGRVGYATDLGECPRAMLDAFTDLDVLGLEANYDLAMQRQSPRPVFLKERIMGPAGHLSNEQCADAVAEIALRSNLQRLLLLHLSRDCNTPALAAGAVGRRCAELAGRTVVALRSEPTQSVSFARAACPLAVA